MMNQNIHANIHHFIPPVILSGLIHYAEQQQVDYRPWFEGLDINLMQLNQTDCFLDLKIISEVIQRAIKQYPEMNLGLSIGRNEALISMGILGFTMQAFQTVEEALKLALKYHPISGSALNLNAKIGESSLELEAIEHYPNAYLLPFFCEEAFASTLTFLNNMVDQHNALLNVKLSYRRTCEYTALSRTI